MYVWTGDCSKKKSVCFTQSKWQGIKSSRTHVDMLAEIGNGGSKKEGLRLEESEIPKMEL